MKPEEKNVIFHATPDFTSMIHSVDRSCDYTLDDGTKIWELVRHTELSESSFSTDVDYVEILPNVITEQHYHSSFDEIFYVVEGTGKMNPSHSKPTILEPGMCFVVQRRQLHSFQSFGEHLRMLTISLPIFDSDDVHFI